MNGNGIFVEIDGYSNTCTGTNFGFADGGITNGYVPPDKQLTSAQLIGNGNVQDFDSGRSISVSLNLTLTGVGPISSSISSSISRVVATHTAPLNMSVTHSANTNRAGITSGSISIEGFSLTPIFFFADLITNGNSQVIIQR